MKRRTRDSLYGRCRTPIGETRGPPAALDHCLSLPDSSLLRRSWWQTRDGRWGVPTPDRIFIDNTVHLCIGESAIRTGRGPACTLCHSLFRTFRQECLDSGHAISRSSIHRRNEGAFEYLQMGVSEIRLDDRKDDVSNQRNESSLKSAQQALNEGKDGAKVIGI